MADSLIEDLKCPICFEYCSEPVETNCCHKIFCKGCMEQLNGNCAYCRIRCTYIASVFAQRLINSLPFECEYCEAKITIGDVKNHNLHCDNKPANCPVCKILLSKSTYLAHLIDSHKEFTKSKINAIIGICEENKINEIAIDNQNKITIDTLENSRGFRCRLGSTGKYYCGQALDFRCRCCDGFCGPTSGCNCSPCMQLDIKSRNLPKGWLVNSDGYVSRRKTHNDLFYCGRKVMNQRGCDGYCGPYNGPNCFACKVLDKMTRNPNDRYFDFI